MLGHFGQEEIAPFHKIRQDNRISTSRLLPQILQLKGEGKNYREIGKELGLTKRQVEHVMAQWRKSQPNE
jgi:DNA-binding NarL/FixJ family response regulator